MNSEENAVLLVVLFLLSSLLFILLPARSLPLVLGGLFLSALYTYRGGVHISEV